MFEHDFLIDKTQTKKAIIARIQNTWRKDLPKEKSDQLINALVVLSKKLGGDTFLSDGMLLWGREIGWMEDPNLLEAILKANPRANELLICWRTHVLCWAASQAAGVQGDFFEFGCFQGFSGIVIRDFCDGIFKRDLLRKYWWFDLFKESKTQKKGDPLDFTNSEAIASERAGMFKDIQILKGDVRETFIDSDLFAHKNVAFAHLDLNNCDIELEIIDSLMSKVVSGSVLVFDDYAMSPFRRQNNEYREYFSKLSIPILELPTGQGVVIIPPSAS